MLKLKKKMAHTLFFDFISIIELYVWCGDKNSVRPFLWGSYTTSSSSNITPYEFVMYKINRVVCYVSHYIFFRRKINCIHLRKQLFLLSSELIWVTVLFFSQINKTNNYRRKIFKLRLRNTCQGKLRIRKFLFQKFYSSSTDLTDNGVKTIPWEKDFIFAGTIV